MSEPITVFDIPLLLDMICDRLTFKDIRNCSRCCKAWYGWFGPYRFQFIRLRHRNNSPEGVAFLVENSQYIRTLDIKKTNFDTFVHPKCCHLRKLRIGIPSEYKTWTEDDSDDPDKAQTIQSYIEQRVNYLHGNRSEADKERGRVHLQNTLAKGLYDASGLVQLLDGNPGLRKLYLSYQWKNDHRGRRTDSIARPLLEAVQRHTFLKRIKLDMNFTCFVLAKILNHLPRQLEELEVRPYCVVSCSNHDRCDRQSDIFKAQDRTAGFGIRQLLLGGGMECFMVRMVLTLLERCPDLEILTIPNSSNGSWGKERFVDMAPVAQVLDGHCPRLHTLNQDYHKERLTGKQICDLVQGYSKGFQTLRLTHGGANEQVFRTLVNSATVSRIEILTCSPVSGNSEDVVRILVECPLLREFRLHTLHTTSYHYNGDGADLSDLLSSLENEGWKCWNTLEKLEMALVNKRAVKERKSPKARRRRTAHDARLLCLQLRTAPKLKSLTLKWFLRTTWIAGSTMDLTLEEYNESAVKKRTTLLTNEDMRWAGLPRYGPREEQ
ncbi:MAG: hypothetical protein J3Q66DRAFT_325950 [Benniella sp.]|nr:MAG: hypothetical protein J3Q66DRAFT_325950 [Benniella sp.]